VKLAALHEPVGVLLLDAEREDAVRATAVGVHVRGAERARRQALAQQLHGCHCIGHVDVVEPFHPGALKS